MEEPDAAGLSAAHTRRRRADREHVSRRHQHAAGAPRARGLVRRHGRQGHGEPDLAQGEERLGRLAHPLADRRADRAHRRHRASPHAAWARPLARLTRLTPTYQMPPRKPHVLGLPLADPFEVKRRLAAIFAADVEGYSRLRGPEEDAPLTALTARREILDGLIATHGGRIANTAGDSVLAEFGSAVDAVRCAMEAQGALAKANSTPPETRHINFRIGVHVGDVMVRAGDLFGDGVNIAARLQTLARAAGLCVSGVTYDQVRKILPLSFTDLGAQTVKNIEEPIRAYDVKAQGVEASSALGEASSLGDGKPLALPDKPSIAVLP